jgi:GTP-binding protein
MTLGPNTSPFAGKEGKYSTSRQLGERLTRELENNVSLRVETLDNGQFRVAGRGELHLSILLETMRREGYEMEVGKPEVVTKLIDGIEQEPVEELNIVVDNEYVGAISQELGKRQAQLLSMEPMNEKEVMFNYSLPTRSMLGLRSFLMTQTKGTLLFSSQFSGFEPLGQPLPKMRKGALIAAVTGKAVEYGLRTLKGRGISFVQPGSQVYEGMIVGQNARDEDIAVNVCKEKNLTNHRSKSHQGITQLAPDLEMSLEQAIDFLERDELLEITPLALRPRKKFLSELDRRRSER